LSNFVASSVINDHVITVVWMNHCDLYSCTLEMFVFLWWQVKFVGLGTTLVCNFFYTYMQHVTTGTGTK